jgi:hypothetical protein
MDLSALVCSPLVEFFHTSLGLVRPLKIYENVPTPAIEAVDKISPENSQLVVRVL